MPVQLTLLRRDVEPVFARVDDRDLVLAVLARVNPPPDWDGCEVGLQPHDGEAVALTLHGQGARDAAAALVQAFAQLDIAADARTVERAGTTMVRVQNGRWSTTRSS